MTIEPAKAELRIARLDGTYAGGELMPQKYLATIGDQPVASLAKKEELIYVRGREASVPFLPDEVPTDAAIVGIVDHWSLS